MYFIVCVCVYIYMTYIYTYMCVCVCVYRYKITAGYEKDRDPKRSIRNEIKSYQNSFLCPKEIINLFAKEKNITLHKTENKLTFK